MAKTEAQIRGRVAEDFCAQVLNEQGYSVIARNFTWQNRAEIDLIATRGKDILFIEVKARSNDSAYGGLSSAISKQQIRRIRMAAELFLKKEQMHGYNAHLVAALIPINASNVPISCKFIAITD